jgi:hypothetical protein
MTDQSMDLLGGCVFLPETKLLVRKNIVVSDQLFESSL